MPSSDAADTVAAAHRLKNEIDALTDVQIEALKQATYVGMTPDEAKQYDERRKKIAHLIRELTVLERAQ
jgi:hypothetical protein